MTKDAEYKGFWFLPNKEENRIPGILYFRANKEIKLELIGGFETGIQDFLVPRELDIIHGITNENKNVTLFNCYRSGNWNLSSKYPTTNYNCHYLIIGKHLIHAEENVFDRIQIELTSLYDWYPSARIRNTIKFSKDDRAEGVDLSISDSDYWEKSVQLDDDFTLKIFGNAKYDGSYNQQEFIMSQDTSLEITGTKSKKSFVELLNKAEIFKQFLSLASLSTVNYIDLTLFDNEDYQQSDRGKKLFNSDSLFFIKELENIPKPKRYQFLFTYNDIEDVFPDIIKKWYALKEEFAPIRNHLIESIKTKKVFTSLDFLITIQALEGYHRRFIDVNNQNKRKILRNRINELINIFDSIRKIHNNPIDLTHIVKSRDYYSHFYKKDKNVLDGIKLFKLSNQLRTLLICCILRLIGLDLVLIDKLLNKNDKI
jgi:hypothetical protein